MTKILEPMVPGFLLSKFNVIDGTQIDLAPDGDLLELTTLDKGCGGDHTAGLSDVQLVLAVFPGVQSIPGSCRGAARSTAPLVVQGICIPHIDHRLHRLSSELPEHDSGCRNPVGFSQLPKGLADLFLVGFLVKLRDGMEDAGDGYSLGWGKGDGKVLKNHYPKGLRR